MIRTQIQLTEEQARRLKSIAQERGISVAEVIRQSIDLYIQSSKQPTMAEKRLRALSIVGRGASGESDLASEHDRYLAEVYGESSP